MSDLTVTGVTLAYENTNIIEDINIELHDNELVCLLGASGGGKTTLFNVISGLKKPDQGKIMLDGRDITGQPGNISYMLQKDLLLPYRTIEDNVALPLLIKGENKKAARQKAGELFQEFGLEGTQKKYPKQLSGGMRQRAALLRTYMFSKNVALLDEPFSALDTLTKSDMHRWYLDVMDKIHLSTLFITHDIDEAILLSDRIYLLTGRPGRITEEIVIREPKPRRKDFNLTEEFLEYKKDIEKALDRYDYINTGLWKKLYIVFQGSFFIILIRGITYINGCTGLHPYFIFKEKTCYRIKVPFSVQYLHKTRKKE